MKNYIKLFQSKKPLTDKHPVQSGVITINEPLPAGDYEFGLYDEISKKGNPYRGGTIRPAFKKEAKSFSEPKEPENNFNPNIEDEEIPF